MNLEKKLDKLENKIDEIKIEIDKIKNQYINGIPEEVKKLDSNINSFLEENKIENEPTRDIYLRYSTWCCDTKLKALSQIQFSREICKRGYKTTRLRVNGTVTRIFVTDVTDSDR